jgi:hypothetical protein
MELSMKDIGKKINKMVQVKKVGPMVPHMKEIINKVKKVGKVNLNGPMEVLTMVNLKIII